MFYLTTESNFNVSILKKLRRNKNL